MPMTATVVVAAAAEEALMVVLSESLGVAAQMTPAMRMAGAVGAVVAVPSAQGITERSPQVLTVAAVRALVVLREAVASTATLAAHVLAAALAAAVAALMFHQALAVAAVVVVNLLTAGLVRVAARTGPVLAMGGRRLVTRVSRTMIATGCASACLAMASVSQWCLWHQMQKLRIAGRPHWRSNCRALARASTASEATIAPQTVTITTSLYSSTNRCTRISAG